MRRDEGRDRPSRGRSSVQLVMGDGANCCDLSYLDLPLFTRWIYIYIYVCISCDGFIDTYGDVEGSTLCWNKRESFIYMCI